MLKDKIALVTGGGRGIGRAIAIALAKDGATVVVNYSGSKAAAEEVVEEIKGMGREAMAIQCNVADHEATKEMLNQVIKTFGRLDILVNNAGITKDNLMMRMSEADFGAVIDVNLKGTFNTIKHISRQMLKQKGGRIINISSVVGLSGNAGQMNYAASKAGILGLTKSAAKELGSRGITVNAIAPGFIETEMTEVLNDDVKKQMQSMIPMGTLGKPEDVADAVCFLASDRAKYITGQVISVDGGMHM